MARSNAHNSNATQELGHQAVQMGRGLSTMAKTAGRAAEEQVQNVKDMVTTGATTVRNTLTSCIEDRPISSVLVAAGIGMFVGLFMFRR